MSRKCSSAHAFYTHCKFSSHSQQNNDIKSPNLKLSENKTPDSKSMLLLITQCCSVSSKPIFSISFTTFYITVRMKVDSPTKLDYILYSRKLREPRLVSCSKLRLSETNGWRMCRCSIIVNDLARSARDYRRNEPRTNNQRAKLAKK